MLQSKSTSKWVASHRLSSLIIFSIISLIYIVESYSPLKATVQSILGGTLTSITGSLLGIVWWVTGILILFFLVSDANPKDK